MKYKILSLTIFFCIMFCFGGKITTAKYYNIEVFGEIICEDKVNLTSIALDVFYVDADYDYGNDIEVKNYEKHKTLQPKKDGTFSFIAPQENFIVKINLESLPSGYGVDKSEISSSYEENIRFDIYKIDSCKIEVEYEELAIRFFSNQGLELKAEYTYEVFCNEVNELIKSEIDQSFLYVNVYSNNLEFQEEILLDYADISSFNRAANIAKLELLSSALITETSFPQNEPMSATASSMADLISQFDTFVSNTKFNVYYNNTGADAITQAKATEVLTELGKIEQYFCSSYGYMRPTSGPNNKLNVFIYELGGSAVGYRYSVNDYGYSTPYSYICLDAQFVNNNLAFPAVLAHEYFHAIYYVVSYEFGRYSQSFLGWFLESTAQAGAFLYLSSQNYTGSKLNAIKEFFRDYLSLYYDDTTFSFVSGTNLNHYSTFMIHLFIYQRYGGHSALQLFMELCSSSSVIQTDILQIMANVCKVYNQNMTINTLFVEYYDFTKMASQVFQFGNMSEALQNINTEIENKNPNNYTSTPKIIGGYRSFEMRIDDFAKSHQRFYFKLTLDSNNLATFKNNVKIYIYRLDKYSSEWQKVEINISDFTYSNEIGMSNGNNTSNQEIIIQIVNLSYSTINFSIEIDKQFLLLGECDYMIVSYNAAKITVYVDASSYVTVGRNIYARYSYDTTDNFISHKFSFIDFFGNNQYSIIPYATCFEVPLCFSASIGGTVYNVLLGEYSIAPTLFSVQRVNYSKFYTIKLASEAKYLTIVGTTDGSNYDTDVTSPGNVVLRSYYNDMYQQFRFVPFFQ